MQHRKQVREVAPALLKTFTTDYPDVTIKFTVANRAEIIKQLAGNDVDLVIMGRPPRELDTIAEPFAKHPFVIIAPPSHPLAGKRRIQLRRLAAESFIVREEGSGTRASMQHVFRERGVPYRAWMEVNSNETIKQSVIAGLGLSFISSHTIGLEVAARKIAVLDVVGLPIVRDWFVIHLREKKLAPIASVFRALLLEHGAAIIHKAVGEPRSE